MYSDTYSSAEVVHEDEIADTSSAMCVPRAIILFLRAQNCTVSDIYRQLVEVLARLQSSSTGNTWKGVEQITINSAV